MSKTPSILMLAAIVLAAGSASAIGGPGQAATRSPDRLSIQVDLPLKPKAWIGAVGRLEQFSRMPLGLELTPEDVSGLSPDQPGTMLVLTGLSLPDAVRLMTQHDRRYVAQAQSPQGVINIRPSVTINARDNFLNRVLPSFALDRMPLDDALHAVHQSLDPTYRKPPHRLDRLHTLEQRIPRRGAQIRAALARPITVKLTNATVRDVLNAIAVADGEMWWYVTYRTKLGIYEDSKITFAGFDNWAIAAQAHGQPDARPSPHRPGHADVP